MAKTVYFNSSMPRAGSTLLQNIFAQNPRFYASPTSGLVSLLLALRIEASKNTAVKAQDPKVMSAAFRSLCGAALTAYYDGITDRPVCIDKSRGWPLCYEWLDSFYPKPRIVICVRDLRAILSSMEKLWRRGRADDPGRENDGSQMSMITVHQRVQNWMNSNPVGVGVLGLVDLIQRGLIRHFHVIKYESLTSNPKATMKGIYEYFGEPYFEHDFDHVVQATFEDDAQYGYVDHKIREGKVEPAPLDYMQVLGKDVSAHVRQAFPLYWSTFYPNAS